MFFEGGYDNKFQEKSPQPLLTLQYSHSATHDYAAKETKSSWWGELCSSERWIMCYINFSDELLKHWNWYCFYRALRKVTRRDWFFNFKIFFASHRRIEVVGQRCLRSLRVFICVVLHFMEYSHRVICSHGPSLLWKNKRLGIRLLQAESKKLLSWVSWWSDFLTHDFELSALSSAEWSQWDEHADK